MEILIGAKIQLALYLVRKKLREIKPGRFKRANRGYRGFILLSSPAIDSINQNFALSF